MNKLKIEKQHVQDVQSTLEIETLQKVKAETKFQNLSELFEFREAV